MNLKIAIVENRSTDINQLMTCIQHYQVRQLVQTDCIIFTSEEAFLKDLKNASYHIIFFNVNMSEDSLAIAHKIRSIDKTACLVFTADTDAYALQGYEVHAYSYQIKPFESERIQTLISDVRFYYGLQEPYITVKENRCNINILINDIIYVDVDNHYLQIHTTDRIIRTYMRFRDFQPMLDKYPQFLCCYRNVLVNMNHIVLAQDMDFKMDNDDFVPIRRNNKKEIRQQYLDYLFNKSLHKNLK